MADITMSDAPSNPPEAEDGKAVVLSQSASEETETFTMYAAGVHQTRHIGCGVAYVQDAEYVGTAWALGMGSHIFASSQAVFHAYRIATYGGVMGTAKKLVIVTTSRQCKEALGGSQRHKDIKPKWLKKCSGFDKKLRDSGVAVEIKQVRDMDKYAGLRVAFACANHGASRAVGGAKKGDEPVNMDASELAQVAAQHERTRQGKGEQRRGGVGISRELRRQFKKQRRAEHEARREEKFQHLAENGPSQPTRRSVRLQEQAEQNVLQTAFGQLEVRD